LKKDSVSSKPDINACREIAPGVYYMEVGKGISRSNVFFVRSGASWVLIDAASAHCGLLIQKTAESLFGVNTRPDSILLTHDHPDHAGSALELARMWGCPVYVHPDEMPLVTLVNLSTVKKYANPLDRYIILPLLRLMPRRRVEAMLLRDSIKDVVQGFNPGSGIPGLPGWECIPTPGHTPGHVAFFRTNDRFLITGDSIVTVNLNSFWGFLLWCLRLNKPRISGPPWYSTWNWQLAKKSAITLKSLEPRVIASGHGLPMAGDSVAVELRAFADHFAGTLAK